jgi:signal transduction histidine kinase
LELKVRDNGNGITKEQISDRRSFGLLEMRERANALAGEVEIKGAKGKGTTVMVRIPIEKEGET